MAKWDDATKFQCRRKRYTVLSVGWGQLFCEVRATYHVTYSIEAEKSGYRSWVMGV